MDDDILLEVRGTRVLILEGFLCCTLVCFAPSLLYRILKHAPQTPFLPKKQKQTAQVVMFVGVLCAEATAPLLVASGLVATLFALMGEKKDDDEFVLQARRRRIFVVGGGPLSLLFLKTLSNPTHTLSISQPPTLKTQNPKPKPNANPSQPNPQQPSQPPNPNNPTQPNNPNTTIRSPSPSTSSWRTRRRARRCWRRRRRSCTWWTWCTIGTPR